MSIYASFISSNAMDNQFINLKIGTLNVRGLNSLEKRTVLFDDLKTSDFTIICLQETKLSPTIHDQVKTEWHNQKVIFNSIPGAKSGTMILINSHHIKVLGTTICDTDFFFVWKSH